MKNLKIGVHTAARDAQGTLDAIVRAEKAGINVAWMTSGGVAPDPLAVFSAAALRTERIQFGTSIIPTFPRHPLVMTQGAMAVDSLAPNRLRLGVGPSHKPAVEATFGMDFDKPLQHLREYVTILNAILKEGKVDFEGKRLTARAQLAKPTGVQVLISALRENAMMLAGELTDGAITWVTPFPYIRDVAVPALEKGAQKAGRPRPPLIAHVPVVVSENTAAVRAAAQQQIGFYPRLPFYSQMMVDAGFPEAAEGKLSDALIDELVIHGNYKQVSERIRSLPDFKADEIIAAPLVLADDRDSMTRTFELLGALAKGD